MTEQMRAELLVEALEIAIWQHKPEPGLIHHWRALLCGDSVGVRDARGQRAEREGRDDRDHHSRDSRRAPLRLAGRRPPHRLEPRYSPHGRWIVIDRLLISSNGDQQQAVFIVGSHGGRVQQLTPWSANAEHPTWSPDSRWILFNRSPS
jgi:tricorn protease-like protein